MRIIYKVKTRSTKRMLLIFSVPGCWCEGPVRDMGPRAGLDGCGEDKTSYSTGFRTPNPLACTEQPHRPHYCDSILASATAAAIIIIILILCYYFVIHLFDKTAPHVCPVHNAAYPIIVNPGPNWFTRFHPWRVAT